MIKIETPEQHEAQLMHLELLMKLNPALNTPEDVFWKSLAFRKGTTDGIFKNPLTLCLC